MYRQLIILGICWLLVTNISAQTCTPEWHVPNNVSISKVTGGIERENSEQDTKAWLLQVVDAASDASIEFNFLDFNTNGDGYFWAGLYDITGKEYSIKADKSNKIALNENGTVSYLTLSNNVTTSTDIKLVKSGQEKELRLEIDGVVVGGLNIDAISDAKLFMNSIKVGTQICNQKSDSLACRCASYDT